MSTLTLFNSCCGVDVEVVEVVEEDDDDDEMDKNDNASDVS